MNNDDSNGVESNAEMLRRYNEKCKIKVMYINQLSGEKWNRWKYVDECTDEELKQANLRQIMDYEIVLDIDNPDNLEFVIDKLKKDGWAYELWKANRGYHVHLYFDNLAELDIETRTAIRRKFIRDYKCDEAKSSEKTVIATENQPHFKDINKIKELIENGTKSSN